MYFRFAGKLQKGPNAASKKKTSHLWMCDANPESCRFPANVVSCSENAGEEN
jgi:hypothetical protein